MYSGDEQAARASRLLHEMAYRLCQAGYNSEEVVRRLVEAGIDGAIALDIASFAAASYQSARSEAMQGHWQKGALGLIGGLVVTGLTYAMAGPGGTFLIATGAILYGLFHLATALLLRSTTSMTIEDSLRIVSCVLMLGLGVGLLYIAERFGYDPADDFTYQVIYWIMLAGGYLSATLGLWGLIDKSAMRLRTGHEDEDALTAEEWRKAGWIFLVALGLLVGHVAFKQGVASSRSDLTAPGSLPSPLASPLETPVPNQ